MIYNLSTIYLFIQDHAGSLPSARIQQNEAQKHRTHPLTIQSRDEEAMCKKKYRTPSLMHRETTQDNPCQWTKKNKGYNGKTEQMKKMYQGQGIRKRTPSNHSEGRSESSRTVESHKQTIWPQHEGSSRRHTWSGRSCGRHRQTP